MKFSNDNSTWLGPFSWSTSYTWTIPSGDGTKTVYARYFDSSGQYGAIANDTITLDTIAPGRPDRVPQDQLIDLRARTRP